MLLDAATGQYFQINPTGRMIWQAIGGGPVSEIISELCSHFEDAPSDVDSDVLEFLGALHDRRLIRVEAPD
ncbi:MAG: PqqD family protein [Acidimicrobiia bacterium]